MGEKDQCTIGYNVTPPSPDDQWLIFKNFTQSFKNNEFDKLLFSYRLPLKCCKLMLVNIWSIDTLYYIMLFSFLGQYALMRVVIGLYDPDIDLKSNIQYNISQNVRSLTLTVWD